MSTPSRPLLEAAGHGDYDGSLADECASLRRRADVLEARLEAQTRELQKAHAVASQSQRALKALRTALQPTYNGLRMVFGELDAAGVDESDLPTSGGGSGPRAAAAWEIWKSKLGGKQAEFIKAMQDHGAMTTAQLKVVTHSGSSTIPQIIYKLNKLGLINKNGGKFSLKEI